MRQKVTLLQFADLEETAENFNVLHVRLAFLFFAYTPNAI